MNSGESRDLIHSKKAELLGKTAVSFKTAPERKKPAGHKKKSLGGKEKICFREGGRPANSRQGRRYRVCTQHCLPVAAKEKKKKKNHLSKKKLWGGKAYRTTGKNPGRDKCTQWEGERDHMRAELTRAKPNPPKLRRKVRKESQYAGKKPATSCKGPVSSIRQKLLYNVKMFVFEQTRQKYPKRKKTLGRREKSPMSKVY